MLSSRFAGIPVSSSTIRRTGNASVGDPREPDGLSLQQLRVAGFTSEWWPASNRKPGQLQIGIGGRIASEFAPVEAFATDEHRLGLKPVVRRVWAPIGARPIAPGHHRFEWLYVTAFVSPATGECFWYISNGMSKPFFEALLATFAEEAGAGRDRIIVLVLDNAGWHGQANLKIPEGIRLLFLPPYTPELQPAEHLWEVVDEPVVNKHVPDLATLENIVAERCANLANDRQTLKGRTGFNWWPKIANPK